MRKPEPVCVCVFVGGKKGGERIFEIAAGLCQRLLALVNVQALPSR